jgi:hypothetical protein
MIVHKLTVCIPVFARVMRPNLFVGGRAKFDFIVKAMLGGILTDFTNETSIQEKEALQKILTVLLTKFQKEGLQLTPEQIRAEIERRREAEKQEVIKYFDAMDLESRRIALLQKQLGIGERFGISRQRFMKLDPEIQRIEAERRAASGLTEVLAYDFPVEAEPGAEDGFDVADYGEGEGEF